ncbi:glycosyltransferase family 2 protein [Tepidamorphus sp. 3E244]|uniref:glycosyltransferase family 2 protein n=1 Tax=Tepidamorphus sp. 3E244 TaxID=3385498 RepID=UPI0038FBEA4B
MLISVIISTYNRPDALNAVLRGMLRQTDRDFEVLVADDGSDEITGDAIHAFIGQLPVKIQRVWQPDRGFRLAAMRNRAIAKASGNYFIFLDGDCVPRADFVARHRALSEPGHYVFGQRILLSKSYSERILNDNIDISGLSFPQLAFARMRGHVNRALPALPLPLGSLRKAHPRDWRRLRGCNFAAWREDVMRVDGFDGSYVGWGLEDSDFAVRLCNAGVRAKDGRFATAVLHLWHPMGDREMLAESLRHFEHAKATGAVKAQKGLSSLTIHPATRPGTDPGIQTDEPATSDE